MSDNAFRILYARIVYTLRAWFAKICHVRIIARVVGITLPPSVSDSHVVLIVLLYSDHIVPGYVNADQALRLLIDC